MKPEPKEITEARDIYTDYKEWHDRKYYEGTELPKEYQAIESLLSLYDRMMEQPRVELDGGEVVDFSDEDGDLPGGTYIKLLEDEG